MGNYTDQMTHLYWLFALVPTSTYHSSYCYQFLFSLESARKLLPTIVPGRKKYCLPVFSDLNGLVCYKSEQLLRHAIVKVDNC